MGDKKLLLCLHYTHKRLRAYTKNLRNFISKFVMTDVKKLLCCVLFLSLLIMGGGVLWYFALPSQEVIDQNSSNTTVQTNISNTTSQTGRVSVESTTPIENNDTVVIDDTVETTTETVTTKKTTTIVTEEEPDEDEDETVTYDVNGQTCRKLLVPEDEKCKKTGDEDYPYEYEDCTADYLCTNTCCGVGYCDSGSCICPDGFNPSDNCNSRLNLK